tara:strand:+ start:475 stop:1053 length:579 start_codon:yes stop_codon:yes gene_type:complete
MSKSFYGVGYNSKRKHKTKVNGKHTLAYEVWKGMLMRCYCPKYQAKKPTYKGCGVSGVWHDYQNFADWYELHDFSKSGYQLDKDILFTGNKIYSPETCCFVPHEINSLLNNNKALRGLYPQGVYFDKPMNMYRVRLNVNSQSIHLGYSDCPNEAHQIYIAAKEAYVKEKALEWQDRVADDVFQALMNWTFDS